MNSAFKIGRGDAVRYVTPSGVTIPATIRSVVIEGDDGPEILNLQTWRDLPKKFGDEPAKPDTTPDKVKHDPKGGAHSWHYSWERAS